MKLFDLPEHLIPEQMKCIAQACGEDIAAKLFLTFPGVHLYIPHQPIIDHRIAYILDTAEFQLLCDYFGNTIINMPSASKARREIKRQQILSEYQSGLKQWQIAINHGMTERTINHICNNVAADRMVRDNG